MKPFNKINLFSIICLFSMLMFCFPQSSMAQRFGHGGGGGGGMRGGGGNRGGGEAHPGGGFNGGSRNFGNHVIPNRGHGEDRHVVVVGGGHSENVFHHVYGVHNYFYHPYHPYIWGPYWHPFGFFINALAADAFLFTIANQQYYYENGVYYEPYNGGYTVVAPPIGAVVSYLPAGYETVQVGGDTYYYYGGAFYLYQGGSYRVVPGPIGAIVYELPEGATDQNINGQDYLLYNNTYYQPISQNGQDAYEVVQVN